MQTDTILQGDIRQIARTLPDQSVHTIVTSPPYYGLRDYGTAEWEGGREDCDHKEPDSRSNRDNGKLEGSKSNEYHSHHYKDTCPKCGATRKDAQIGLEASPQEYVETLVGIFRELRRVLRDDGTVWLNLGDSYASSTRGDTRTPEQLHSTSSLGKNGVKSTPANSGFLAKMPPTKFELGTLKPKDLIGIPWRVALALQADGWYLRSDIIWAKANPMPESVTDRPTKAHEYIFLLSKKARYYYDQEAVREPHTDPKVVDGKYQGSGGINAPDWVPHTQGWNETGLKMTNRDYNPAGRNRRTVWTVATKSYKEAHFATFPPDLIRPCILAGCPKRVCAECGAPWVRVVEKTGKSLPVSERHGRTGHNGQPPQISGNYWTGPTTQATDVFEPTCICNAPAVPGIVFDPFFGSGTVGQVAVEEGRSWLGCELNQEYIDLAWKRIYAAKLEKIAGNGYAKQMAQEIDGYKQLGLINAD